IAQEKSNPWSFEFGVNAVDVYPIGENAPYGDYMDEFFNLNDHWNMGGFFVGVTRDLTKHLSISARGTSNELSKWGDVYGDESVLVDNLKYYSLDGMVNINFTTTRLQPYIAVGGGYTWIEEGLYNTFSLADGDDNLVGAGTLNGALGAKYQLSDHFALNLQFMYKHTFEDYLTKHWQHSLGVVYSLGGKTKKEEVVVVDTDGDGIEDSHDLCPDVYGVKAFAGCPDTDNDGIPDSLDKCPNEKGANGSGCPEVVVEKVEVVKTAEEVDVFKSVFFDLDKATLDNNAKVILDGIADLAKDAKQITISVNGYTDSTGSNQYNKSLSDRRANTVKDYLTSNGVSGSNIQIASFGEDKPTANNNTADGRALNRRAEVTVKVVLK
ncbi:MAG: OmpA family protein, partial [Aestuariibaculum sp.]